MGGGSAIMTLLDQYTRECLCIHADRSRTGEKSVKDTKRLIGLRSAPESITSDSGNEFAGQTRDVRRTKREYLRSSIEILESTASPDRRVLDRVRAPNLNLSAASFFGAGQNGKLLHFSLY
jgi:transposase InsO family protein